jgi:hypothetical protein
MSRVVYRGGFGNGQMMADRVGDALGSFFEGVEVFTDTSATRNASDFRKAAKNATLITHSKGYTGVRDAMPEEIIAFSPSLPSTRLKLFGGALIKGVRMLSKEPTQSVRLKDILKYNASSAGELIAHPLGNFWPLISGEISNTDSLQFAMEATDNGVHTHLMYFEDDEMYQPQLGQRTLAAVNGTPIIDIPGVHDQIVLTPHQTIQTSLEIINTRR